MGVVDGVGGVRRGGSGGLVGGRSGGVVFDGMVGFDGGVRG